MKYLKYTTALALACSTFIASAMDKGRYEEIAIATIQQIISGDAVDADSLIGKQKELISIAKEACREYAGSHPEDAKLLNLVIERADEMQALSLDDIEEQWHEYGLPNSMGVKTDKYEHFAPTISLMDTVVHPATAIIVLNNYKNDGDREALQQVKDELSEVLEHLHYIP